LYRCFYLSGFHISSVSNPPFESDAAKARRASTTRSVAR
jgi:hypothetical protein